MKTTRLKQQNCFWDCFMFNWEGFFVKISICNAQSTETVIMSSKKSYRSVPKRQYSSLFIMIQSQDLQKKISVYFLDNFSDLFIFSQRKRGLYPWEKPNFAIFDHWWAINTQYRVYKLREYYAWKLYMQILTAVAIVYFPKFQKSEGLGPNF